MTTPTLPRRASTRGLTRSLLLVGVVLALPACFRLARNPPPVLRFALTSPTPMAVPASGVTIGVRRSHVAAYLAVPWIVVRRGDHEIVTSEFHRWGEKLEESINRVVSAHLANTPGVRAVEVAPWAALARHDFVVQLHVSRFEGVVPAAGGRGQVAMQIRWDILRPIDGRVLMRGTTEEREAPWTTGDYGSLVRGLDASLARVAQDISGCLAGFRNDSPPPATCGTTAAVRAR
jgi:uncharacterized lipoprotein YmbA